MTPPPLWGGVGVLKELREKLMREMLEKILGAGARPTPGVVPTGWMTSPPHCLGRGCRRGAVRCQPPPPLAMGRGAAGAAAGTAEGPRVLAVPSASAIVEVDTQMRAKVVGSSFWELQHLFGRRGAAD